MHQHELVRDWTVQISLRRVPVPPDGSLYQACGCFSLLYPDPSLSQADPDAVV
jgi:hypothetical protein